MGASMNVAQDSRTRVSAASHLAAEIERLRTSSVFQHYQYVRDWVLEIKDLEAEHRHGVHAPSDYWEVELANFDYMLDASPLIINKLRHHCHHITGVRPYDCRPYKSAKFFEMKRAALMELGGAALLVPESRALGGFGFEIDGELYNIDTLKFYEALIALERGAILQPFRESVERRAVWEIGAGWGGFAYQFKTLFPNVTCIITDFAELFLFSAVYLLTLFPNARAAFYGRVDDETLRSGWREFDFIFVPHTFFSRLMFERLDLTVNMVSFQEMTSEQVEAYVRHAFSQGCPYLYSLNRSRSRYNPQLTNCHEIMSRYYWPHPIPVLPISYGKMISESPDLPVMSKVAKAAKHAALGEDSPDYRHVIGWRRNRV